MPPIQQDTIGGWAQSQLVKFIQDLFTSHPPENFPQLKVERLTVTELLTVEDKIGFNSDPTWRDVGSTGQPLFENGWASWGLPYHNVGFWRDPFDWVHLRGVVKSGLVGKQAFTLPVGFRPDANIAPFAVVSGGVFGRVDVGSDGTVTPISPSANTSVSLSQIVFKAA